MDCSSPSSSSNRFNPTSTTSSSISPSINHSTASSGMKTSRRRKPTITMLEPSNIPMLQSPKFSSLGNLYRLREHLPYGQSTPPNLPSPSSHPTSYFRQRQQRPQKNESRCLQYVMPGLFMAFEDDSISFSTSMNSRLPAEEELRTPDGQTFTHIIKLTTSKNPSGSPDITYTVDSHKTQVLNLDVFSNSHNLFELRMRILASETDCDGLSPEVARRLYTEYGDISEPYEGIPLLTPKQLLASREFMCATGYDLRRRQGAQILITAPRDHCTDIVSVLVCYLAYASRSTVAMVLLEIDRHPEFLGIWKNTVSGHGVSMIQDVVNVRS